MPVFNNMLAGASGGAGAGYAIERSLRFDDAADSHLSKTFATAGNRKKWTLSFWTKRSGLGTEDNLFTASGNYIRFEPSDVMRLNNGSIVDSTRVFRDPSAWYHVVWVWDTAQATASDRSKVYVNNEIVSFSGYPAQYADSTVNNNVQHIIGAQGTGVSSHGYDGYIADMHFIDGQALAPTDFGETDDNGVWQAIEYAGTYGESLDQSRTWSGDLSASNLASPTLMFNWTYGYGTYTGTCTWTTTNAAYSSLSGRVYLANNTTVTLGITFKDSSGTTLGSFNLPWTGNGTQMQDTGFDWSSSVATVEITGDYLPVRVQIGNKTIVDSGVTVPDNSFYLPFSDNSASTQLGLDYSQGTPGTNNKGMEVVTYTGNGGTQSIDNLAFQPDFVWIKNRTAANGHVLSDVIRGATKFLRSDATDAEATNTTTLTSFDSNGFTVGNNAKTGATGSTYVAWAWKAGGAAVSNTDGTITSQVSANNTYGFSIVNYTGNSTVGATVGHGLNSAPELVIFKNRDSTGSWNVIAPQVLGAGYWMPLNASDASSLYNTNWTTTSSTIVLADGNGHNGNNQSIIAYCWSEVAGFSKFGSYTGNGLTDGPTVTLGFKPRYILLKSTSGARSWCIYDTARDTSATNDNNLFANNSNAESSDPLHNITILDDGFKLATGNVDRNGNGETFFYAAFAANPANDWDVNNLSVASNIFSQTASGQNWMQYKATYNNNTVAQTKTGSRYRIALDDLFSGINDSTNYTGTQIFGITNFNAQGFIHNSLVSSDGTATTGFANSNDAGSIWKGYFNYPTNSGKYASIAMYDGSATDGTDFPVDRSDNDSLVDTPTNGTQVDSGVGGEVVGNYATLNPLALRVNGGTISNGNLSLTSTGSYYIESRSTIAASAFNNYSELTVATAGNASDVGFAVGDKDAWIITGGGSYLVYREDGAIVRFPGNTTVATVASFGQGDVLGMAVDDTNVKFYKNGSLQGTYAHQLTGDYFVTVMNIANNNNTVVDVNFGQRTFAHTAPSGYKALCTANLPDPTIEDGSLYFDTKLWTGNDTQRNITGLAFSPDFTWIKQRSGAASHSLMDTVRGATKNLLSNDTNAEGTEPLYLNAFLSDGFSIGASSIVNDASNTYVGWSWDAGSSNTTIAAGSLNSSVYDQSQTWSSNVSKGTGNVYSNNIYVPANIFDGNSSTYCKVEKGSNSNTVSFDLTSTISGVTSIRVQTSSVDNFSINGGSNIAATGGAYQTIYDGSAITLTSLKFIRTSGVSTGNSDTGLFITSIEINGSQLVDSGVTPATNVPSIASTVRANPSAGFSIVSYSGNGSNDATIGHQLNAVPEFIIVKNRSNADDWFVYSLPTAGNILKLNGTDALLGSSHFRTISSSTFQLSGNADVNANGDNFIAYCFAPVEGYSAFGKYTGNGSADGPFVYTGHSVAWIMIKRTDAVDDWVIYDVARDTYNIGGRRLYPDLSNAESQNVSHYIDILSNGFKVRSAGGGMLNASGGNYIYMSFAENPFKTARAR